VISSKAFSGDFEGFLREVQRVWDLEWERVYGAAGRGERLKTHHPKVQLVEYSAGAYTRSHFTQLELFCPPYNPT
jgi:hypothetical protein